MIIDGKLVSSEIKKNIKDEVIKISEDYGKVPGLAVVMVGDNPASAVYVRNKEKACECTGIKSYLYQFPENTEEEVVVNLIHELNKNDNINGILVQLPLPKHLNENYILSQIDPNKDVDGFSAYQMGKLVLGFDALTACTPTGIMALLDFYNIDLDGKNVVMIGRSNIVGKPMAFLLLKNNATVTICHSHTKNIGEITKQADVVIVAIGNPEFLTEEMVKEGAVVIDVGINRTPDGLKGDVDFEHVSKKASYITPVPGGVGPMTVTMLLSNTLKAFLAQNAR